MSHISNGRNIAGQKNSTAAKMGEEPQRVALQQPDNPVLYRIGKPR
jgi:hypothetical protein